MRPLIHADWILSRRALALCAPLFLLSLLCIPKEGTCALMIGYQAVLVGVFLPLYQDLSPYSMETLRLALPVSRAQIVSARYLSILLAFGMGGLFALLVLGSFRLLGSQPPAMSLPDLAAGLALQALPFGGILFLYLPFHFRFEGERAVAYFMATLLGLATLLLTLWGWQTLMTRSMAFGQAVLNGGRAALFTGAGFILLGLASLGLSLWSYRTRLSARPAPGYLPFLFAILAFYASSRFL